MLLRRLVMISFLICLVVPLSVLGRLVLAQTPLKATVTRVIDGDTFLVQPPTGSAFEVRVFGADAPERDQAFGAEAAAFTTQAVLNREVALVGHGQNNGRTVAEVRVNDADLGRGLIANGWAWWDHVNAPAAVQLGQLEIDARAHHRGIFADRCSTPPWIFRNCGKNVVPPVGASDTVVISIKATAGSAFHRPTPTACSARERIQETRTLTRTEAENLGLKPCGICKP